MRIEIKPIIDFILISYTFSKNVCLKTVILFTYATCYDYNTSLV